MPKVTLKEPLPAGFYLIAIGGNGAAAGTEFDAKEVSPLIEAFEAFERQGQSDVNWSGVADKVAGPLAQLAMRFVPPR